MYLLFESSIPLNRRLLQYFCTVLSIIERTFPLSIKTDVRDIYYLDVRFLYIDFCCIVTALF